MEFRNYELQWFSKSELDENAVVAELRTLKIKIPRYKIGLGTVYLSISSIFCRNLLTIEGNIKIAFSYYFSVAF